MEKLTKREKASLNSETCSSVRESACGNIRVSACVFKRDTNDYSWGQPLNYRGVTLWVRLMEYVICDIPLQTVEVRVGFKIKTGTNLRLSRWSDLAERHQLFCQRVGVFSLW